MADQIRLGFIGAGGMATAHTDAMKDWPGVELAAVTDVNADRAKALSNSLGADTYPTPEALCADAGVDAVFILLPPFAHGEAERAALKHQTPFFIEKPIGLDLGLTKEIADEVRHANLLTSAGYMNRYREGVNAVKEALKSDPAVLVHGGWIGGAPHPGPEYSIVHWWIQKEKSGGQFLEQVTHSVDLLRYLCGEVVEVSAYAAHGFNKGIPNYTMEDAVVVGMRLERGGVASLMACSASNAQGGIWLNVYAPSVAASFSGWEHSVVLHRQGREDREIKGEPDIFAIEDRAFLDAVKSGDRSGIRCTYDDAARTLAVSVAANEAMAVGKPVTVWK